MELEEQSGIDTWRGAAGEVQSLLWEERLLQVQEEGSDERAVRGIFLWLGGQESGVPGGVFQRVLSFRR